MGITLKNATKLTLLVAALYQKAKKGDLSAFREILLQIEPQHEGGGVVLIDDIQNTNK